MNLFVSTNNESMISEETQSVAVISLAKPFQKLLHTSAFILLERVNCEVIISVIGVSLDAL